MSSHDESRSAATDSPLGDLSAEHVRNLLAIYRPYLLRIAQGEWPEGWPRRADNSDVVQETLLRGVERIAQFQGSTPAELAAWLRQILKNLIRDEIRRQTSAIRDVRREITGDIGELHGESPTPSVQLIHDEELARLSSALEQLPSESREAITLRMQGLSFEEIGRHLGKTGDAARVTWGRAIDQLIKLTNADGRKHA